MKIERIGSRGVLFTFGEGDAPFEYNTSVYLIDTGKRLFLCDTHTGPRSMETVKKYIKDNGWIDKELIIFNSHADWDHIWGNCAFGDAEIISHARARKRMQEEGSYDLEKMRRFHNGTIELKLPNLTFDSVLAFEEDEIEFVYAPGHTEDSSICFDRKESVLFVGDLIEAPLPFISCYDLQGYLHTLETIVNYSAKTILSAHSGIVDKELLKGNIDYIKGLAFPETVSLIEHKDEDWQSIHNYNVKNIMYRRYLDIVREKLGKNFDYVKFKKEFWGFVNPEYDNMDMESSYFRDTSYEKLEAALIRYMEEL